MSELIEYEIDRGLGILRINRPEARNALNWSAQEQFAAAVETAAVDGSLRALIITASGDKAFASGGDIKELAHHTEASDGERLNRVMGNALARLTRMAAPVVCAVNGDAIGGGCEIMSACDLRLASQDARFRFAQVQVGLTTGWGGGARLIHLLGAGRAMELLLTGRTFDAPEALAMGFVQRLVEHEQVMSQALAWAETLRALPRGALAANKRLVWGSAGRSLDEAYQLEKELFVDLWPAADHLEAMAAFNDRRRPQFGDQ